MHTHDTKLNLEVSHVSSYNHATTNGLQPEDTQRKLDGWKLKVPSSPEF